MRNLDWQAKGFSCSADACAGIKDIKFIHQPYYIYWQLRRYRRCTDAECAAVLAFMAALACQHLAFHQASAERKLMSAATRCYHAKQVGKSLMVPSSVS